MDENKDNCVNVFDTNKQNIIKKVTIDTKTNLKEFYVYQDGGWKRPIGISLKIVHINLDNPEGILGSTYFIIGPTNRTYV